MTMAQSAVIIAETPMKIGRPAEKQRRAYYMQTYLYAQVKDSVGCALSLGVSVSEAGRQAAGRLARAAFEGSATRMRLFLRQ